MTLLVFWLYRSVILRFSSEACASRASRPCSFFTLMASLYGMLTQFPDHCEFGRFGWLWPHSDLMVNYVAYQPIPLKIPPNPPLLLFLLRSARDVRSMSWIYPPLLLFFGNKGGVSSRIWVDRLGLWKWWITVVSFRNEKESPSQDEMTSLEALQWCTGICMARDI